MAPSADAFHSGRVAAFYLSKRKLGRILDCERCFHAEDGKKLEWSPQSARGSVSHKAIDWRCTGS